MTVINTNVGALQARTYAVRADSNVTKSMERLSSGLRINSAADDAAGLAVANKMESQIRGMNMAIRNSQDGISLVQTAESAMGEINNMVIRMRELAVQMNNGVYTDADRANAQLEVTALLQEIDKVATNSSFNQVKTLDGTYSQDIRAGNTNAETINVTIDRMNTDTLGGGRVTAGDVDATGTSTTFKTSNTNITATEGRVTIAKANLGTGIQAYETANTGGTWSLDTSASDDNALFEINSATGAVTLNSTTPVAQLDFENPTDTGTDNVYSFKVQYTQGGTTVTDNVSLNITDKAAATTNTAGTAALTVEEGDCIKIYSVDVTDAGAAQTGIFSDQFKEFVAANAGDITYAKSAGGATDDSGDITLNTANGIILANLDFERATDSNTDNVYNFTITATNGAGVAVSEDVTLTVTDAHAAQSTNANVTTMTAAQITAAADGAITNTADTAFGAADTVAVNGTIEATLLQAGGANVDLTWANLDSMMSGGMGADNITSWLTEHGGAANVTMTVDNAAGSGVTVNGSTGIRLAANTAAADYEDVRIKLVGQGTDLNEIMYIEFDLDVTAGAADQTAANIIANGGTDLARSGAHTQLQVLAGGEAMTIDLKVGQTGTTTDTLFNAIGDAYVADPCGTFEVVAGSLAYNDDTTAALRTNLSVTADGVLSLAAGATAGTYSAMVAYTDNDGEKTFQRMDITSTDVGEAAGVDIATATALTAAAGSRTATEQVAGTSVLSVAEARQGNIASTGTNSVLSAAFNTFVASYTGGSYSVSGTDSALFSIDASTGALETKGLVDFETKTSYSMTVSYTSGANTYSEDITLNVTDNAVDNTTHIANVDLSTQAGSATGVTILDKAIDQISESQAKLGAIQNRLQYNIDNLSKASMLTTTAKGRIMDADFAAETSELSKQQILSQAATSMLAQANQSKQSVLALLQ